MQNEPETLHLFDLIQCISVSILAAFRFIPGRVDIIARGKPGKNRPQKLLNLEQL